MPEPVAVGLIGCGWIAELAHIPTLERSRVGRLAAIAEADAARRTRVRSKVPAAVLFEDGAELIKVADVQAVIIALPTALTAAMARAAFRAGKNVYVEKPGSRSAAEWQPVVDAWSESGRLGMVGYNFRRSPLFLDAIGRVRDGVVGKVLSVQARFTWAADHIEGWRASTAEGGGALLDLASHHVDLMRELLDEPVVEVRCTTRSHRVEQDTSELTLSFRGGATAQLLVSSAAGANENGFSVIGSEGILDVNLLDARPRPVRRPPGRLERVRRVWTALQGLHPARLMRSPGREPSFEAALTAFLDGILTSGHVQPDPRDALEVLNTLDAARDSAQNGGAVVAVVPAASDA